MGGVPAESRAAAHGGDGLYGHRPDSSLARVRDRELTPETKNASVPALVASSLLRHDLPDVSPQECDAAAHYIDDSVAGMPDVTRFGVRIAGGAAYAALCVFARGSYRRSPEQQRAELAARLVGVPLPVLGEFGRLVRGLGLVAVHEHRGTGPTRSGS